MTDAEQRDKREKKEIGDSGCQEERDRKAPGGWGSSSRAGETRKREAESDKQRRLRAGKVEEGTTGEEEEEEGPTRENLNV